MDATEQTTTREEPLSIPPLNAEEARVLLLMLDRVTFKGLEEARTAMFLAARLRSLAGGKPNGTP